MDDRGVTFLVGQNAQDNHAIIDESTYHKIYGFIYKVNHRVT